MKKCLQKIWLCVLAVGVMFAGCTTPETPTPTPDDRPIVLPPLAGAALVSGEPVPAIANDGLSPLNLTKTTANALLGAVYMSSQEYPDLFVSGTFGLDAKYGGKTGVHLCEYKGKTADGRLIYSDPKPIEGQSWDWDSRFVRVVKIGDTIYGFFLSATRFRVSTYDESTKIFTQISTE